MAESQPTTRCECGTDRPPELLSCPVCDRLTHTAELKQLVAEADELQSIGDIRGALGSLRTALTLLPPAAKQHAIVHRRVASLSDRIDAGEFPEAPTRPTQMPTDEGGRTGFAPIVKAGSAIGALGLLFWKFKFVLVFLVGKGKLLLLGLTKSTTLFTMLLSLGVYWTAWGWRFALGLVLSIYVHEMGHVAALRRFGIKATAPMFIPGLGAVVRMDQYPQTAREDARVGLAGPIWGLAAALAVYGAYLLSNIGLLAAIASVGAWINLFNLLPFWQLDGARGFRGLSRLERWLAVGVIALMFGVTGEGLLILLGLGAAMSAFSKSAPPTGDRRGLIEYSVLVVALALLATVPVEIPG